jgi:hypothetical protein
LESEDVLNLPSWPPSTVGEHPDCPNCRSFQAWLVARDRAERTGFSHRSAVHGLSWLKDYFDWGPVRWPAHWCDFVTAKKVDCGGYANMVARLLDDRSVRTEKLQIIELATSAETVHWKEVWHEEGNRATEWILDPAAAYHEGLVIHDENGPVLFDTTTFRPIHTGTNPRSGSPLWVRYHADFPGCHITWNDLALPSRQWIRVADIESTITTVI